MTYVTISLHSNNIHRNKKQKQHRASRKALTDQTSSFKPNRQFNKKKNSQNRNFARNPLVK